MTLLQVINSGLNLIEQRTILNLEEYIDLVDDLDRVIRWRAYTPSDKTFQELTSSGNLSKIRNDSIKDRLLELDQINARITTKREHVRYEYNTYIYNSYFHEEELFKLIDFQKYIASEDWIEEYNQFTDDELKAMIENTIRTINLKPFKNAVKMTLVNSKVLIEIYNEKVDRINILDIEIDREINN